MGQEKPLVEHEIDGDTGNRNIEPDPGAESVQCGGDRWKIENVHLKRGQQKKRASPKLVWTANWSRLVRTNFSPAQRSVALWSIRSSVPRLAPRLRLLID
jgi:hypothetical protein